MRIFAILILFNSLFCAAVEVSPMVLTLDPTKPQQVTYSTIHNVFNREVAFDIEVFEVDFSGSKPMFRYQENSPVWVFPPTLLLHRGESQRIQLRWVGDAPSLDKTYQISLVEQPLSKPTNAFEPQLMMLLNVNLIVHVHQESFLPELVVEKSLCSNYSCEITVANNGKGAARLSEYDLTIYLPHQKTASFKKQQLKASGYDVFFAPQSKQQMLIPLKDSVNAEVISPDVALSQ
tara:strand:+ start:2130 stop:2831 length:702 start_codon:yes stop_codon:yes gene_type:complete